MLYNSATKSAVVEGIDISVRIPRKFFTRFHVSLRFFAVTLFPWYKKKILNWPRVNKAFRHTKWECSQLTQPEWRQSRKATIHVRHPPRPERLRYDLHVISLNADVLFITEKHVYIPWYTTVHWHQKYRTNETILWICGMFKVFQENAKRSSQNSQHSH